MSEQQVLVVDLDGTLSKTDLSYGLFLAALSQGPRSSASAIHSLLRGRAHLKASLSARIALDPASLPYNECVLEMIRDWRAGGRRTVLYTDFDQIYARAVAEHLDLFDEVHDADEIRNLKGHAKASFLDERFGKGRYDYVGRSRADLPVWESAGRAITVGASPSLRTAVETVANDVVHLQPAQGDRSAYLTALRPQQWLKNLLIFVPLIASHDLSAQSWRAAFFAFIAFCMVASSAYVLNDLLDLGADREHPRKRNRPLASGALPITHGTIMAPSLLIVGAVFAIAVGQPAFLAVIAIYYGLTTAYSLSLKRMLAIDICTLAGLYTLRVFAGSVATGLPISVWLLAFSIFFFLSLAAVKRQAELVDGVSTGRLQATGRAYHVDDLPIVSMMAIASGYISVLVMALYINSPVVESLYRNPRLLWGVSPLLLFWISRMVMIAHRGKMDDDPIVFALRDRTSQVCGLLIGGLVAAGSLL